MQPGEVEDRLRKGHQPATENAPSCDRLRSDHLPAIGLRRGIGATDAQAQTAEAPSRRRLHANSGGAQGESRRFKNLTARPTGLPELSSPLPDVPP